MSRRSVLVLLGLPVYALLLMVFGWLALGAIMADGWSTFRSDVLGAIGRPAWFMYTGIPAIGIVITQCVALLPVHRVDLPRRQQGHSLVLSCLVCGVVGAALTVGLFLALAEAADQWENRWGNAWWGGWLLLAILVASWVFWSILLLGFSRFGRRRAEGVLGRAVGVLLAGSVIELLVVLPLDVIVRRRTDCYCATGTAWSLALATAAALWLTGPGIVIAVMSRRRRAWRQTHCEMCGYAKGPTPGPRCTECGSSWSA